MMNPSVRGGGKAGSGTEHWCSPACCSHYPAEAGWRIWVSWVALVLGKAEPAPWPGSLQGPVLVGWRASSFLHCLGRWGWHKGDGSRAAPHRGGQMGG